MNHQQLRCYNKLLEIAKAMPTILESLPKGTAYIEDQFKRALMSAMLNMSEGNARPSVKEKRRFFDISLASMAEASTAIDILAALGYIHANIEQEWKSHLRTAYAMLFKLSKSLLTSKSHSRSRSES